jgi:hypothetical protein
LDDAMAITVVLGCQLTHLVTPTDDSAEVRLSPKLKASAERVRRWLRGLAPFYIEDARYYFTGPVVPNSELEEFFSRRPAWADYGPERPGTAEGGDDG